jgi:hypothetical protein
MVLILRGIAIRRPACTNFEPFPARFKTVGKLGIVILTSKHIA